MCNALRCQQLLMLAGTMLQRLAQAVLTGKHVCHLTDKALVGTVPGHLTQYLLQQLPLAQPQHGWRPCALACRMRVSRKARRPQQLKADLSQAVRLCCICTPGSSASGPVPVGQEHSFAALFVQRAPAKKRTYVSSHLRYSCGDSSMSAAATLDSKCARDTAATRDGPAHRAASLPAGSGGRTAEACACSRPRSPAQNDIGISTYMLSL